MQNALHMGWAEYCAALVTALRMREDIAGRTLLIHNGDVSYAECAHLRRSPGSAASDLSLPSYTIAPAPAGGHKSCLQVQL